VEKEIAGHLASPWRGYGSPSADQEGRRHVLAKGMPSLQRTVLRVESEPTSSFYITLAGGERYAPGLGGTRRRGDARFWCKESVLLLGVKGRYRQFVRGLSVGGKDSGRLLLQQMGRPLAETQRFSRLRELPNP